jgi:predicted nucleotidyltransferase
MRLFRKEARRPDVFLKRVRRVSKALTPVPMAVWLFGSAARLEDTAGGDIDLAVIGPDEKTADRAATALREALVAVEAKLGVTASVLPMALSKVKHVARAEHPLWLSLRRDAIPLMGPLPDALIRD